MNENELRVLLGDSAGPNGQHPNGTEPQPVLYWRGEITAANAESVWAYTFSYLRGISADGTKTIDLSHVRFIDSTGLGLMVRARKQTSQGDTLQFIGLQPAVRNVLRLSRMEDFLLGQGRKSKPQLLSQNK